MPSRYDAEEDAARPPNVTSPDKLLRAQGPGDQAAVGEGADAKDRVIALVDEVDDPVSQGEFDVDLWIRGEILRQRPSKFVRAKGHRGVHPDLAARDCPALRGECFGRLDLSQDGANPLVEAAPHLGEALPAGRTVDQPDVEVVLQQALSGLATQTGKCPAASCPKSLKNQGISLQLWGDKRVNVTKPATVGLACARSRNPTSCRFAPNLAVSRPECFSRKRPLLQGPDLRSAARFAMRLYLSGAPSRFEVHGPLVPPR
jgi:hypothetical protein